MCLQIRHHMGTNRRIHVDRISRFKCILNALGNGYATVQISFKWQADCFQHVASKEIYFPFNRYNCYAPKSWFAITLTCTRILRQFLHKLLDQRSDTPLNNPVCIFCLFTIELLSVIQTEQKGKSCCGKADNQDEHGQKVVMTSLKGDPCKIRKSRPKQCHNDGHTPHCVKNFALAAIALHIVHPSIQTRIQLACSFGKKSDKEEKAC